MKNEIALRYLLLRHIKSFEERTPKSIFAEVAKSLHVTVDNEFYIVTWQIAGMQKSKRFLRTDFQFYRRGDLNKEKHSIQEDLFTSNDAIGRSFALETLDIRTTDQIKKDENARKDIRYAILEHLIFVLILVSVGGIGYGSGLVLICILVAEYLQNGSLYSTILFIVFAFVAQGAAVVGAVIYGILQFLNPESIGRKLRVTLNFGVLTIVVLLWSIGWSPQFRFTWYFFIALLIAFIIAGFRSLFYIHNRLMPLVLPFVCAGFILDGKSMAAVFGLIFSLASTLRVVYFYGSSANRVGKNTH